MAEEHKPSITQNPFVYETVVLHRDNANERELQLRDVRTGFAHLYDLIMTLPNCRRRAAGITELEKAEALISKGILFGE